VAPWPPHRTATAPGSPHPAHNLITAPIFALAVYHSLDLLLQT